MLAHHLDGFAPAGRRKAFRVIAFSTFVFLFLCTLYSLMNLSQNSHYLTKELNHKASPHEGEASHLLKPPSQLAASSENDTSPISDAAGSSETGSHPKPSVVPSHEPLGETASNAGVRLSGEGIAGLDSPGKAIPVEDKPPSGTQSDPLRKSEIQKDTKNSTSHVATPASVSGLELDVAHHDSGPKELPKHLQNRRFVLVIPANSPNTDLCKTVATALALGYPSPVIINWGVDHRPITKWKGGANLPKIPGFVQYLDAAMHPQAHPSEKLGENDLVLMVDAYDVWFQLPAEILVQRYHDINAEANARLREQWPAEGYMPMRQTIVAGSGKNCHPRDPKSGSNLRCDIWPESPLRADLYGPDTEKNETLYRNHRPRYINGGLYMGPAGDMRRLFRRAQQKMETGINKGIHMYSEQGIPGEVFAEQETWRQLLRKSNLPLGDATRLVNRDFEYHFGLDYAQGLSAQTFWTDLDAKQDLFDGQFVKLDNQTDIDGHSKALGISPVRLHGVPDDVQSQRNPLLDLGLSANWGNLSLYADFFLESVPAILHHNGFKSRRKLWWHKPWFYPYLRKLLALRMRTDTENAPLATVQTAYGTIKYWAPLADKGSRDPRRMDATGPMGIPLAKMRLHDVCHDPGEKVKYKGTEWWEEVFRDRQGPFVM